MTRVSCVFFGRCGSQSVDLSVVHAQLSQSRPQLRLELPGRLALSRGTGFVVADEVLQKRAIWRWIRFLGIQRANRDRINQLLVDLASEGLDVVRLKGGDPFIFGRGGEEMAAALAAGLECEIVPGITAAAGAASCTGIPLTHREHAQTLVFATGHLKDDTVDLDWTALARPRQTVVIYMGLGALDIICERLIAHGLPAHTPAAVIHAATTPGQCGVHSTVARLPAAVREAGIRTPALIMIGEVVALDPGLLLRRALSATA